MSRLKTGLSLGEYAILGVLRERPMHGYEIARRFAPDGDFALVLPMDMSNVYAMLKDLQEQGLIEGERQVVGLRPPRTVFHLTPDAEGQFHLWLEEPVRRMRELRSDLLVKLFFCRTIGSASSNRLLDGQLVESRAYLDRLLRLHAGTAPGSFERLVYDSKIGPARAAIEWLTAERSRINA